MSSVAIQEVSCLEHRNLFSCGITKVKVAKDDLAAYLTIGEVTLVWLKVRLPMQHLEHRLWCYCRFLCIGCERRCVAQIRCSKGNSCEGSVGLKAGNVSTADQGKWLKSRMSLQHYGFIIIQVQNGRGHTARVQAWWFRHCVEKLHQHRARRSIQRTWGNWQYHWKLRSESHPWWFA